MSLIFWHCDAQGAVKGWPAVDRGGTERWTDEYLAKHCSLVLEDGRKDPWYVTVEVHKPNLPS
jgi:hypothetical protein